MLLGDIMKYNSLLKYVAMPWQIKMNILQRNNGLCMHNILTKKLGKMCDICRCGHIFKSLGTLLLHLNKSLSNYQSDCSILSRDHI